MKAVNETAKLPSDVISPDEYKEFREFLERACGIVLGENKQYLVSSRLNRLINEYKAGSLGELMEMVRRERPVEVKNRVIEAMTTNETSWFRDSHPFEALKQQILPDIGKRKAGPARVWSAACSSGQEPYSIGMTVHEFQMANPGMLPANVEIVATDISPAMLEVARNGAYDALAMARGLSPERKKRYFQKTGDLWEVIPAIRSRVQFRELNLLQSFALLGRFDAIFCRNVLIYFSSDSKRDILTRMVNVLNPGGYLLLGGSESINDVADSMEMVRINSGVVYRKIG